MLSVAPNVLVMLLAWCGVQATLNAMLAAVTAMIPDQVPVARRGRIGGITAVAQTVGVVAGTGIAAATGSIAAGYLAIAVFLLVLAAPFALTSRDPALPVAARPPFVLRSFLASFWISPRAHPDFGWAWLTRFLVNLGNALGLLYLLYFLQDVVGYSSDEAEDRVFLLTAVYALTLVLTTVVFGAWSDRLGRRKVFVIWSGLVSGSAAALLGIGQTWPAALTAAVVMGCAYGIYTAVDFALVTEVLPAAFDRGKDLGVINIANALPQVVAPVLAGVLLAVVEAAGGLVESDGSGFSVGYFAVYFLAFLASVLGSVFVTRIRGVR
jgi:MFS family permease